MKCYHRTSTKSADAILDHGFRNGIGDYMTPELHEGVFLSDRPLDETRVLGATWCFQLTSLNRRWNATSGLRMKSRIANSVFPMKSSTSMADRRYTK